MALLCSEADLLILEPGLLGMAELRDCLRLREAAGTLAGTTLTLTGASWTSAGASAGMGVRVTSADGTVVLTGEITAVADATHATVSAFRVRGSDPAVALAVSGSVSVTVMSFGPQIAGVGDDLLALVGASHDRDAPEPALEETSGFRSAAIYGTLAALFRMAVVPVLTSKEVVVKEKLYQAAYLTLRRSLVARVDLDGDGVVDSVVRSGVRTLERY